MKHYQFRKAVQGIILQLMDWLLEYRSLIMKIKPLVTVVDRLFQNLISY